MKHPRQLPLKRVDSSLSLSSCFCSTQLPEHPLRPLPRQKTYRDFRLQGVTDPTLNGKSYETVYNRLTVEEATAAVKAGDKLQGVSMRDSDEDDD